MTPCWASANAVSSSMPSIATQIVGRLVFFDFLFDRQRIGEQRIARTRAQLLDDVLVEAFDAEQLGRRHVGDFLDRREAFLHEDLRDLLVDLELFLEQQTRGFLLGFALRGAPGPAVMTLSCQPVSLLARRTFWPPRPIACESLSSATAMSIECFSSSTMIDCTSAGAIALMTNCAGLSFHSTMSMRSPFNSFDTACTREPRMPMQAPIGSVRWSCASTAILARSPGSRAQRLDLDQALADFRHFELEQLHHEFRRGARR